MMDLLPMVLIPGLLTDRTAWKEQIRHFQPRYELILPQDHWDQPTIAAMAEHILEGLPPQFALVGWSMGGYISFEIMRRAPHRVSRLALISTSARQDPPQYAVERRASVRTAREFGPAVAWRQKMGLSFYRPERLSKETITELERVTERLGADLYESQQEAIIGRADSRDLLQGITCPTIVICGTHDSSTPPPISWEIASAVSGAELHLLAECGHCSPIEDPETVNALLGAWMERSHE